MPKAATGKHSNATTMRTSTKTTQASKTGGVSKPTQAVKSNASGFPKPTQAVKSKTSGFPKPTQAVKSSRMMSSASSPKVQPKSSSKGLP